MPFKAADTYRAHIWQYPPRHTLKERRPFLDFPMTWFVDRHLSVKEIYEILKCMPLIHSQIL